MANTEELVSIVMPSLNHAKFIEHAVRSVLDQDYLPLELIVMDGSSVDETLKILGFLSAEYGPKLRVVSGQDSGPANAVNKALRCARGNVIGWLNSDDLYATGAVRTAVSYMQDNPELVMTYGEGEHIDAAGKWLERYPTKPPFVSIDAFQDGCFICQPTVFFRRTVLDEVGFLDENLKTAFDFEFWLRIFRQFPARIGYISHVQAMSRVHESTITSRARRTVALEGLQVLSKHIGQPSPRWLFTYIEELYVKFPFETGVSELQGHVASLIEEANCHFDEATRAEIAIALKNDHRLQLSLPGIFADVFADGWAGRTLDLRVRPRDDEAFTLALHCAHQWPVFAPLRLNISTSWGRKKQVQVKKRGSFEIEIAVPGNSRAKNLSVLIESDSIFVPRDVELGSSDSRELSFKVDRLVRR